MNIRDEFQALSEAIEAGATAGMVYSTPIERRNRTVVPIAMVEYGLGGGGGGGGGGADGVGGGGGTSGDDDDTEGGGLGGGLSARPAGALEVSDGGTRFVEPTDAGALEVSDGGTRFVEPTDGRQSTALILAGLVCGFVLCRLRGELGIS